MQNPTLIYGRVVMDGGQPVPEPVSVELRCGLELVQAIRPDLNGNFQFNLGAGPQSNADISASEGTPTSTGVNPSDARGIFTGSGHQLSNCELDVSVVGYQPVSKFLSMSAPEVGGIDAGTLVLSRLTGVQGASISVTSLLAPNKARKEFEKGDKDAHSNHLDSATRHLEKAVSEYDKYAVAWNELGQIYAHNHRTDDAVEAFTKAIDADPQYIPPCIGLANLQLQNGQYEAAIVAAGKALKLYPGMAPASFIQAAANFQLNRLDDAEKSAHDAENAAHPSIPQVHVLLANIYLRKQDYPHAALELRAYLKEAPQGALVDEVKKTLEKIEKSGADAGGNPTPANPAPATESASSAARVSSATLKICLRMQDDSAYVGDATVRVTRSDGHAIPGIPLGSDGETIFGGMLPGTYAVDVIAPGFSAVREQTEINPGAFLQSLFVIMKPKLLPAAAVESPVKLASATPADVNRMLMSPPAIDDTVPKAERGVACPLAEVVQGAGQRVKELLENLRKLDATESVDHFSEDANDSRVKHETRTFDYEVVIVHSGGGGILLDEYRNGSPDPSEFPAHIATTGLPAMALVFDPSMVSGFNLACDGLGSWDGHPAWQVDFAQRADRPNRLRVYVVDGQSYPVPLRGRAWVDAGTFQVRHLETELIHPVQEIALNQEHISIDYGPVPFHNHAQQLWLPLHAEVYWERRGVRIYRRHAFSDFKLFEVQSAQQIQNPAESYCFTNTSDHDIDGILTVSPASRGSSKTVTIRFTIQPGHHVCKLVGSGKDVGIPVNAIGSATFVYNGLAGAIVADANLPKESTMDLIAEGDLTSLTP